MRNMNNNQKNKNTKKKRVKLIINVEVIKRMTDHIKIATITVVIKEDTTEKTITEVIMINTRTKEETIKKRTKRIKMITTVNVRAVKTVRSTQGKITSILLRNTMIKITMIRVRKIKMTTMAIIVERKKILEIKNTIPGKTEITIGIGIGEIIVIIRIIEISRGGEDTETGETIMEAIIRTSATTKIVITIK
jgi:hypothetical protein